MISKIRQVFYRANKHGNGSAFQIESRRGKDRNGNWGTGDFFCMLKFAPQTGSNPSGMGGTFGWKEASVTISLTILECADLILAINSWGSFNAYHDSSKRENAANHVTKLNAAGRKAEQPDKNGHHALFFSFQITQGEKTVRFSMTPGEALILKTLLEQIIILMSTENDFVNNQAESTGYDNSNSNDDGGFNPATFGTESTSPPTEFNNSFFSDMGN